MLLFEPALKASRETSAKFTWQIFTVCSYVVLMIFVTDLADLLSETWSFTQQTLFRCCMTLCIMTLVAAIRVSDACCWKPNGNQMETKWKPSGALSWKVSGRFRGTIAVPLLQPRTIGHSTHDRSQQEGLLRGSFKKVLRRLRQGAREASTRLRGCIPESYK